MRKFFLLGVIFLMLGSFIPFVGSAQNRTITGVVTSDDNTPLAGVTVSVQGTSRATTTNNEGNFSILAATGQTLVLTYVGHQSQRVKVSANNTYLVKLQSSGSDLDEVVVTAMDIKRNPKSLGYSVQSVKGTEIQESQRENFLTSLQGRVAGLTLDQTSGVAGSSSAIVLRGFNSLSLSNQPLYVVDGVIMDNSTLNETSSGGATNGLASDRPNRVSDYQNRIADLNPNDIESVTVLKGPEATALYGSQASSGAIIITTKKAKTNALAVQYDNSFRVQKVTRFPDVLYGYGGGFNGYPSSSFSRFGPKLPDGVEEFENIKHFFRTGFSQTHNLGLDFGVGESKFRLSGTYFDQDGVVPNNSFTRYNFRISNTTKFFKGKLDITPTFSYVNTDNNKVLRSTGGYLLSLISWPATNDIRNYQSLTGDKVDLFDGVSANGELDNPLWNVNNNFGNDKNNRYTYTLGINAKPFNFLTLAGRFGYDTYKQSGFLFFHPQSNYVTSGSGGTLDNYWRIYKGYNHTITATVQKNLTKGLNFRVMGGTMWQDYQTDMFAIYGTNIVDSVGSITNLTGNGKMYKNGQIITDADLQTLMGNYMDSSVTRPSTRLMLNRNKFGDYNHVIQRQIAYFGEVALSLNEYLFLTYTHRFEQSSTLPAKNRKYNYPGVSLSAILTDMFPSLKYSGTLNYWKLRGSRASTARLNSPYSTQSVFVDNLASGGGYSYGFFNNNADLRPETQNTYEIGSELRLFDNRLNFEITYYNTLNKGQIIENFRLSYGTGYVLNTQNAGSTRNRGIEIVLDYNMLKNKNANWDMRFNFNRMRNKVVGLPKNVSEYYIADTWLYTARGGLTLGGPTTSITGSTYKRNTAGQILINPSTGLPVVNSTYTVIGDRNPTFSIGWNNTIRYKNWRFSMLWDLKVGGDVWNGTNQYMTKLGTSYYTADRDVPRVITGVLEDGLQNTANPTKNTIVVVPNSNYLYYFNLPDEEFIENDVNYFRLRDITLSYLFKQKFRVFKTLSAFITGNDLILLTNYSGSDPVVNGNSAGGRGVGAFGFDYGTLSSPMQINIGIKASF